MIKSILAEKKEQREVANTANVGGSKRGSGRVSDEVLLAKAEKGELPESAEDIQRLYKIRKGIK
jgi:hypothetical protein